MKIEGKVKWFNNTKGFGFLQIETRPNENIFVHYSAIISNEFKTLNENDKVLFELRESQKGLQAFNVEKI